MAETRTLSGLHRRVEMPTSNLGLGLGLPDWNARGLSSFGADFVIAIVPVGTEAQLHQLLATLLPSCRHSDRRNPVRTGGGFMPLDLHGEGRRIT